MDGFLRSGAVRPRLFTLPASAGLAKRILPTGAGVFQFSHFHDWAGNSLTSRSSAITFFDTALS
jgi:hypothetical protein